MTDKQEYTIEDNEFKHEDTTHVMKIRFLAGNRFTIYPDKDKSFVAKIGTAGGAFMGTYPVTTDVGRFIVKSADLKGLAVGDYRLEIWEKFTDNNGNIQTRIFPLPQAFVSFTINKNIEDTAWDLVKDISFQDLVNTAVTAAGQNIVVIATNTLPAGSQASVTQKYEDGKNKFTFNIPQGPVGPAPTLHVTKVTGLPAGSQPTFTAVPAGNGNYNVEVGIPKGDKGDKGDTGDTGTVDNAGLISAPAFQSLQAQVDNSAVGTNLLTNTGDLSANWNWHTSISTTAEYNGHPSMAFAPSTQLQLSSQNLGLGNLQNSTQYTASFWAKADNAGDKAHTELWGSKGAAEFVLTTNWARYTAVVTSLPDANTNISHSVCYFGVPAGNKGNVYIAEPKLEKGSVATDWCLNPSEILTQISALQQQVSQLKQKINQSTQPASSASQSTQSAASPATR